MKHREDIAIVTGYIMHYDMLKEEINGSFFSKIDRAIEIAVKFAETYPEDFKWGIEEGFEFEEVIEQFIINEIRTK